MTSKMPDYAIQRSLTSWGIPHAFPETHQHTRHWCRQTHLGCSTNDLMEDTPKQTACIWVFWRTTSLPPDRIKQYDHWERSCEARSWPYLQSCSQVQGNPPSNAQEDSMTGKWMRWRSWSLPVWKAAQVDLQEATALCHYRKQLSFSV